ncbi:MAG: hypothetical protein ACQKBY_00575, partial [Verrucomicrobiales bacterium]
MTEPSQTGRVQGLIDLYAGLDASQFAAEAEKLETMPMSERLLASFLLFSSWSEKDPLAAMEYANSEMGMAGNFVKPTILQGWASADPVNAAKYFQDNPNEFRMMQGGRRGPGRGMSAAGTIAAEWAKQNPNAALNWAQGLEGRDAASATASVITQMAKEDPAEAASIAAGLEGDSRGEALESIAEQWAKTDWAATESWLNTLSGDEKNEATATALESLASVDAAGAADKLLAMPEGEERDRITDDVAGELAKEDPQAAVAWLAKNASEEVQRDSMRDVMMNWASRDAEGAREWIDTQESGRVRDSAVQTYLWSSQQGSGAETVQLAQSISDERDRERAVGMTVRRWMQDDRETATNYIQSSGDFSAEMQERLLNGGDRRRGRGR